MERKRGEGMKDQDRAWQCTKADVTIKTFPPRCVQLPSMHFTNVRQQLRLGVFYLYNSPKQGEDASFYVMTQQF